MSNGSDLSRPILDSDAKIPSLNGGLQGYIHSDIMNPQYMNVQKVPDSMSKGLSESLAGGLLSDLEASEFSQQSMVGSQYYDDDLLSQGLTDDDRRLAAALVAVQLSKNNPTNPSQPDQQTQQAPPMPQQQAQMLPTDLLNSKPMSSMPPIDKPAMPGMVPNYMQSVEDAVVQEQLNNIFPPQTSAPLQTAGPPTTDVTGVKAEVKEEYFSQVKAEEKTVEVSKTDDFREDIGNDSNANESNASSTNDEANTTGVTEDGDGDGDMDMDGDGDGKSSEDEDDMMPTDDDSDDSDYEAESKSRKSLPHKKRIPKKLKRGTTMAPTRNPHAKGAKPVKKDSVSGASTSSKKKGGGELILKCELCTKTFVHQLKFFEHLKSHYEPLITISTPGTSGKSEAVSSTSLDDSNNISQSDFNAALELESSDGTAPVKSESPPPTLSCDHCGKTFRRPKALETHIAMSHGKHEMDDFSEPEDMMEGIRDVVGMVSGMKEKSASRAVSSYSSSSSEKPKRKRGRPRKAEVAAREAAKARAIADGTWQPPPAPGTRKRGRPKKAWKEAELASSDNGFGFDMDMMSGFLDKNKKPKKTLQCTLCPRIFNHRNSLMYHVRSHSGQRPHQCEVCGKSFFAASALKVHLRLHSGAKPYKCEFCERHFRQWGDLKYHITSIHTDQKQFQCEYCGKDFARKYSLIVHRRIHTGEKNYICEFCHKSFRASSYLQNHRRIHTGEKPHQCQICGKPFRVRSDMKRHVATHNKAMVTSSHLQNNDVNQRLNLMPTVNDHHVAHPAVVRAPDGTISLSKVNEHTHPHAHVHAHAHAAHDHYKNMKNPQLLVRFGEDQDSALPDGSSCSAPLNLNIRPHSDSDDGLAYSRESLERESSTLYVWIPAGADHLLPDE